MFSNPNARPLSVTIAAIGVFLFGVANAWRAVGLSVQADLLLALGVTFDPRIRALLAAVWAILFLAVVIAIWRRHPLSRLAAPIALAAYAVYKVGLLLLAVESPVARRGWLLDALFYIAIVLLTAWLLNRTAVRAYFR